MNMGNGLHSLLFTYVSEALQKALTFLVQATLLLTSGLLGLRASRRYSPGTRLFLANGTLAGLLALLILSLGTTGRYRPLWTFQLPTNVAATFDADVMVPQGTYVLPLSGRFSVGLTPASHSNVVTVNAVHPAPEPRVDAAIASQVRRDPLRLPMHGKELQTAITAAERIDRLEPTAPGRRPMITVFFVLAGVWSIGMLLLLSWLMVSCLGMRNLRRRCLPVQNDRVLAMLREQAAVMQVSPPSLLVSDRARGPLLTGLWRPAIVLPAGYETEFAGENLRAVLTHELAHLTQGDGWWLLLTRLLCAVAWPHPLLWALCRQRADACEDVCDVAVLSQGCSGPAYARCLLELAERLRPVRPERTVSLGMIDSRSALTRRIERVLAGIRQPPAPLSRHIKILILCVIFVCVYRALSGEWPGHGTFQRASPSF